MPLTVFPARAEQSAEEAVRACIKRLFAGWNSGSATAFAAAFAEEGHLVAFDGTHFKGRQAIVDSHQPLFDKWLKGTRLVGKVESVFFLTDEIALAHAVGGTVMPKKSLPDPARDSVQTLILQKLEGEWQILAFQNTRLRPIGQSAGSVVAWMIADGLWTLLRPRAALTQAQGA